jgi:hypothetical protein
MDGVYFWSLNVDQKPNNRNVRLLSAHKGATPVQLALGDAGDRLVAIDLDGGPLIEHDVLEGVEIIVATEVKAYQIRIGHVSATWEMYPFWVGDGLIEHYEFFYAPMDNLHDVRPLCSHPTGDPQEITAIVFGGDVYDADRKRIAIGADAAGWFNIACYRGAPWKMHMIGHTSVAQVRLGIVTSLERRHAMLNAWTANVCGTGRAFTHPGEPITLVERPNLLPPDSEYLRHAVSVEAIWGARGALCLHTPRLAEEDLDIRLKIREECGGELPPDCGDWPTGGFIVTGNPHE